MFLVLVLFAAQVLLGLYTTSVVTAVTYDAASAVAGADGRSAPTATRDAEANARSQLGRYAQDVEFTWDLGTDEIGLTVRGRRPTVLPRSMVDGLGLSDVERTARVRVERVR